MPSDGRSPMELARLIAALSAPSAYPQRAETVDVRQTHISVVFLAGDLAYKVKKPIATGFVDYRTLERRRHFCEEEVRLNRRLAPDVYRGVVPVALESGVVRMEGPGEVVDWAVKMTRLPDASTLRGHLARGDLDACALEEWARRLVRFHASAESGPRVSAHCSREAIERNARDTLEESASQIDTTVSRATFDRLAERLGTVLSHLDALIRDRAGRGVPRDTHGDLRLDHIYWFPDRDPPDDWIAVDCIEFDDRFRHADPIADIAFLAMELSIEGRSDLADSFVAEYLRCSGDGEGRALLPFYRAYRAMVRAKVEGMKLSEPEIPEPDRAAARTRARALWLYALSELEEPRRRPCLVLIAGLPGSGKTTLGRALAETAGFAVIRSDEVRKELANAQAGAAPPMNGFGDGLYTPRWNERTYAECQRRAEQLLFQGRRVLIDASFREDARRRLFLDAAREWGIIGCMILCQADPDVVRERLDRRRGDASDADWAIYREAARHWEDISPSVRPLARPLDTGRNPAHSLAQALGVLREFGLFDPAG